MNLFGLEITLAKKEDVSLDVILRRLEAAFETSSGVSVTPDNAMRSPTVHALVTAISRRISTLPLRVMMRYRPVKSGTERKGGRRRPTATCASRPHST